MRRGTSWTLKLSSHLTQDWKERRGAVTSNSGGNIIISITSTHGIDHHQIAELCCDWIDWID